MNALDSVKTALRIKHSKLDESLKADIDTALDELKRVGVSSAFTVIKNGEIEDLLVLKAVQTYCLWQNTDSEKLMEKYRDEFKMQADGLRKDVDRQNV